MKPPTDFSDDYIAQQLAKDAAEQSLRFSRIGRAGAPKPNTRFLRNIVREMDSHNSALLAREQRRRSRSQNRESGTDRGGERERERGRYRSRSRSRTRSRTRSRSRRRRKRRRGREEESREGREDRHSSARTRRHRHHHRRRSRSRSRSRYRSRTRSRSQSPRRHHRRHSHHRHHRRHSGASKTKDISPTSLADENEELIGPQPPQPPARGRGGATTTNGSNPMDAHFDSSYDPTQDSLSHPPSNLPSDNDWDTAVEAYRDRQRWKSLGAERLRAVGFKEEFIRALVSNRADGEEDIGGIKWEGKGGVREWDRGKVIEEDGEVLVGVGWAQGRQRGSVREWDRGKLIEEDGEGGLC